MGFFYAPLARMSNLLFHTGLFHSNIKATDDRRLESGWISGCGD